MYLGFFQFWDVLDGELNLFVCTYFNVSPLPIVNIENEI